MRFLLLLALGVLGLAASPSAGDLSAELRPRTIQGWDEYVRAVQARVDGELTAMQPFLVLDRLSAGERKQAAASLASGDSYVTRLPGPNLRDAAPDLRDGLIHHWLGVVRIPGASLDQVLAFVQRYDDSARHFSDVVASRLVRRNGDEFEIFLKLKRKKIVTVVYNTNHQVVYRRVDASHAASRSVATRIAELQDPGGRDEREKPVGQDSGYLWRLNSYWRFVEADGGVTVECESLTLSRDIPFGFGWLVGGTVEGIARESLEQTLGSIRRALQ
jgi:hypothetical protein